jgi:CubicO group peptidase (beta-lactamase class C family)
VADALGRQYARRSGGAAVCVYFRGRPVVDVWAGARDPAGTPWQSDTMAMSFSTSKGVTATALHALVDRGLLDYDDPVARHWPEFAQRGKGDIRVRHVLGHSAGLPHLRRLIDHGDRMLDWSHMVRVLERARPLHPPGEAVAYHGLTFGWLVGELIQRVTGKRFSDVIRDEIARPLGLDGLVIGYPGEARARAAVMARPLLVGRMPLLVAAAAQLGRPFSRALGIRFDPVLATDALVPPRGAEVFWHPDVLEVPIPAANGLFTARSLARMYAALADGGAVGGARLLSTETLRRATKIQTRAADGVLAIRPYWRLGYHTAFTARGLLRSGFGHFGFGGSGAWADPRRQLAVAMVNNQAGGTALGDFRILQIGAAALRCADAAIAAESG